MSWRLDKEVGWWVQRVQKVQQALGSGGGGDGSCKEEAALGEAAGSSQRLFIATKSYSRAGIDAALCWLITLT